MTRYVRSTLLGAVGLMAAVATLAPANTAQASCTADPYIGSICWTASNYCPRQYSAASGGMLAIADNQALFSLLGCNFGGDCRSTFALPDLRGRSAVGTGAGPGLSNVNLAQKRGLEEVTLDVLQMPAHSHPASAVQAAGTAQEVTLSASSASGGASTPADGSWLAGGAGVFAASAPPPFQQVELGGLNVTPGTPGAIQVTTTNTGGNEAHQNLPPQLGLTACIAVQGLFPPRN